MKSINKISALTLLGILSACSTSVIDEQADNNRAIDFASRPTRAAVMESTFPAGSSFTVWGWYAKDEAPDNKSQVFNRTEVESDDGINWKYEGTKYWTPGCTYNFYAVYPLSVGGNTGMTSCDEGGTITVTDFNCSVTGGNAIDLMTASKEQGYTGGEPSPVSLTFTHELVRLAFTFENKGSAASINVSNIKVYGIPYQATLTKDANGATWNNLQSVTLEDGYFKSSISEISANEKKSAFGDMMLIPVADLKDAMLTFTYSCDGGDSRTATIPIKTTDVTAWIAGKSYNYNITLQTTDFGMNVSVVPWDLIDTSVSWGDNGQT